jgi:hypothetical protein
MSGVFCHSERSEESEAATEKILDALKTAVKNNNLQVVKKSKM